MSYDINSINKSNADDFDLNKSLINFALKRNENSYFNWINYIKNHTDLQQAKINNYQKVVEHWLKHGFNEGRLYGNTNLDLQKDWVNICRYLRNNNYIYENSAFIVTASIRNTKQLTYLTMCLESIRNIYSDKYIYIINDSNNNEYTNEFLLEKLRHIDNKEVISSIVKGAGELNPYLFIVDSRCKHDKLIYIHDTVFIKKNIDQFIIRKNEIDFIWYSAHCLYNDTTNKRENDEIFNKFYFYFSNGKMCLRQYFRILQKYRLFTSVKFGSMSIFTKRFMEKVLAITNLSEVAHLFVNRTNRMLLERLFTVMYIFIYGRDYETFKFICGNIFSHPDNFRNYNPQINYDNYFVKVWQGR
jgi:hypothetical protein